MSDQKFSIRQQIDEVDRELAMRSQVYPRQVGSGKMRQSEAELLVAKMQAVRATLVFCDQHIEDIRAFMVSRGRVI